MIIEVEGHQVEVPDSFATLSPEKQQADLAHIVQTIKPPEAKAQSSEELVNPLMPTIGGALAAETLGPSINKASNAYMDTSKLIKSGWDPKVASDFVRGKFGAVENWGRQMHGGEFFGGRDMPEAWRQGMQAKYPGGIPASPVPGGAMPAASPIPTGPTPGAIPPGAATNVASKASSPTLQSLKAAGSAGLGGTVPAVLGRALAGGSAAFQGADAYNRFKQGDISGGIIGGLGALGSAASMIPTPMTRVGGTVVGLGAEALNAYLDSLKKKPAMAEGGATSQHHHRPRSKAHAAALLIMAHKKQ